MSEAEEYLRDNIIWFCKEPNCEMFFCCDDPEHLHTEPLVKESVAINYGNLVREEESRAYDVLKGQFPDEKTIEFEVKGITWVRKETVEQARKEEREKVLKKKGKTRRRKVFFETFKGWIGFWSSRNEKSVRGEK